VCLQLQQAVRTVSTVVKGLNSCEIIRQLSKNKFQRVITVAVSVYASEIAELIENGTAQTGRAGRFGILHS
jgi:hypothetical protein